jgi:hypothetical protein
MGVIATTYFRKAIVCFNKVASSVSQQGSGATQNVVAIVLYSMQSNHASNTNGRVWVPTIFWGQVYGQGYNSGFVLPRS